ncbi:hypothetical protein E5288_WYG015095 [Bos mutus]|uniref:Uncharacterized protein n=1 Tax=Bos mutus TaxID=72004 RepID=A0A6B0RJI7_9CETA|nr:hypothetical protein [Bos mutus]
MLGDASEQREKMADGAWSLFTEHETSHHSAFLLLPQRWDFYCHKLHSIGFTEEQAWSQGPHSHSDVHVSAPQVSECGGNRYNQTIVSWVLPFNFDQHPQIDHLLASKLLSSFPVTFLAYSNSL